MNVLEYVENVSQYCMKRIRDIRPCMTFVLHMVHQDILVSKALYIRYQVVSCIVIHSKNFIKGVKRVSIFEGLGGIRVYRHSVILSTMHRI